MVVKSTDPGATLWPLIQGDNLKMLGMREVQKWVVWPIIFDLVRGKSVDKVKRFLNGIGIWSWWDDSLNVDL